MEIFRLQSSEALAEVRKPVSKLRDLIIGGYNLSAEEQEDPIKAAEYEYDHADERSCVFVVKEGDEVLGSLTFLLWPNIPGDKRGGRFWPELRRLHPELVEKASAINNLACDVAGIVIDPKARGKKLGYSLYQHAIAALNPAIIVGQTRTVEAVLLRRKLEDNNFRTFYEYSEVTPSSPQEFTRVHESVLLAYLHTMEIEIKDLENEGAVYQYDGGLAATIPDATHAPSIIQSAFKPLIKAQQRIGESTPVMAPLLSIRKELLSSETNNN
jgi:GNAT superfamily N-acetyltransferase